jgi:hypothetical protein
MYDLKVMMYSELSVIVTFHFPGKSVTSCSCQSIPDPTKLTRRVAPGVDVAVGDRRGVLVAVGEVDGCRVGDNVGVIVSLL